MSSEKEFHNWKRHHLEKNSTSNTTISFLHLENGQEQYRFCFDDENRKKVMEIFARFGSNSELKFTWTDVARLVQAVRRGIESTINHRATNVPIDRLKHVIEKI